MIHGGTSNPQHPTDPDPLAPVIPPDQAAPRTSPHPCRESTEDGGASAVASGAADLDATGGANSLDRPYSGPDDNDDHAL